MATGRRLAMKIEIRRLSAHQNAKVLAVIMTVGSLFFLLPVMLVAGSLAPQEVPFPWVMLLVLPVVYLVFGYLMTLIGCGIYNVLARFTGGLEFSTSDDDR